MHTLASAHKQTKQSMCIACIFPECVAKGSCFLSWGSDCGGLFARRFVFFPTRVVLLSMGKVRKGDVLSHVKVHFAGQVWDFVALKRKLLRVSNRVVPLSMGKVRNGDVL